jgi:hypothetical protein
LKCITILSIKVVTFYLGKMVAAGSGGRQRRPAVVASSGGQRQHPAVAAGSSGWGRAGPAQGGDDPWRWR